MNSSDLSSCYIYFCLLTKVLYLKEEAAPLLSFLFIINWPLGQPGSLGEQAAPLCLVESWPDLRQVGGGRQGLCIYCVILLIVKVAHPVLGLSPARKLGRFLPHGWRQGPEVGFGGRMKWAPGIRSSRSGTACLANGGDLKSIWG